MPDFKGKKRAVITTVNDSTEVQLCPKCTFPNYENARDCSNCGYPLQDENIRWLRADLVTTCSTCGSYLCVKDRKCWSCGQSTTTPQKQASAPNQNADVSGEYVLVCPKCSHQNPANAANCSKCGHSLEDVDPVRADVDMSLAVQIENIRTMTRVSLTVPQGKSIIVGRRHLLAEQMILAEYVSCKHFSLSFHDGMLWITDISSNGTYINGTRLHKNAETQLLNGTIVGLGDPSPSELLAAYFKITY